MASKTAAEAVKAAQGSLIGAAPGAFAISVQKRAEDFAIIVFVDRSKPLPDAYKVDGVDVLFEHQDRLTF